MLPDPKNPQVGDIYEWEGDETYTLTAVGELYVIADVVHEVRRRHPDFPVHDGPQWVDRRVLDWMSPIAAGNPLHAILAPAANSVDDHVLNSIYPSVYPTDFVSGISIAGHLHSTTNPLEGGRND